MAVRFGYGSGEEVAAGRFSAAREVDIRAGPLAPAPPRGGAAPPGASSGGARRPRADRRLRDAAAAGPCRPRRRPSARGGAAAARRPRGAARRAARRPTADPGHEEDMAALAERQSAVAAAAAAAAGCELTSAQAHQVRESLERRARSPPPPHPARLGDRAAAESDPAEGGRDAQPRTRRWATTSSNSDSARWWASSRTTPSIEGTPITVRPAARAAATPGRRVLERDDVGAGLDPEAAAGLEVGVRSRLRRRHLVGAERRRRSGIEADQLERATDEGERRVGDERRSAFPVPRSPSSSSRAPIIVSTPCSSSATTSSFSSSISSCARPGLLEPPFQDGAGDRRRGADQFALVRGGELEPAAGEQVLLGPGPDGLGVEQQAVVVEDDRCGQVGRHGPDHPNSRPAPTTPPRTASVAPEMFHVEISAGFHRARVFNLNREDLIEKVVQPWLDDRRIEMGDREWVPRDSQLRILEGPRMETTDLAFGQGWSNAERASENVTRELLLTAPPLPTPDAFVIETETPEARHGRGRGRPRRTRDPLGRRPRQDRRPRPGGRGRDPGPEARTRPSRRSRARRRGEGPAPGRSRPRPRSRFSR